MEPDDLLCSRNARSPTPLVGRAVEDQSAPIPSEKTSKLVACILFLGMALVLVPLRPSNEHILIVRVLRARRMVCLFPSPSCLTAPRPFVTLRADCRRSPSKTEIS